MDYEIIKEITEDISIVKNKEDNRMYLTKGEEKIEVEHYKKIRDIG